jgi:hypothetical protein
MTVKICFLKKVYQSTNLIMHIRKRRDVACKKHLVVKRELRAIVEELKEVVRFLSSQKHVATMLGSSICMGEGPR